MTQKAQSTAARNSTQNEELIVKYEQRLQEIADLVSHVRHEINNPLTGVLGQVQLLLREDLTERARKRAEVIEQLTMRLTAIVAELRDVQKPVVGNRRDE